MPKTWKIGGGWGTHITWIPGLIPEATDYTRVYGHTSTFPHVDDLLESLLESGRTGVYRFTQVRIEKDPPDMFFGKVEWVGYKDELDGDNT